MDISVSGNRLENILSLVNKRMMFNSNSFSVRISLTVTKANEAGLNSAVSSASDYRQRSQVRIPARSYLQPFSPSADSRRAFDSYWRKRAQVLVNCLGLCLPREKCRIADWLDMTVTILTGP